jgi:hypothetical protein
LKNVEMGISRVRTLLEAVAARNMLKWA